MKFRLRRGLIGVVASGAIGSGAGAQPCEAGWGDDFLGFASPGQIRAAVEFDDGRGPALFIAGYLDVAPVARLVDGQLEALAGLPPGSWVSSLIIHDDGTGAALYAGGYIAPAPGGSAGGVVRWREGVWEVVGEGMTAVYGLEVFDEDGDGPAPARLFACGYAGSSELGGIERWDGAAWTSVGGGIQHGYWANVLAVIDDGTGPALFVGGPFPRIGALTVNGVARWDGQTWSALGSGLGPVVNVSVHYPDIRWMLRHDGDLYVGGPFSSWVDGTLVHGMARWDGERWSGFGWHPGFGPRDALTVTTAEGPTLLIAGSFELSDGTSNQIVGLWNGTGLEAIPGDEDLISEPGQSRSGGELLTLSNGSTLIMGNFDIIRGDVSAVDLATWDGEELAPYVPHRGLASFGRVPALAGSAESGALYVGGEFQRAGGVPRPYIAMRDATGEWRSLGDGLNEEVTALALHDSGQGERLFAGGQFSASGEVDLTRSIAMFDGESWSRVGTLNTGDVLTLASIGGELFAGGTFHTLDGSAGPRIARWDGAGWRSLGAGLSGGGSQVRTIVPWNGGVVAGGSFTHSGGAPMRSVAFWDGEAWSALGEGLNWTVWGLAAHQGELYAAGEFTMSGSTPMRYVARWDGAAWRPLPGSLLGPARAIASFDDGTGPALYVGGDFAWLDSTRVGFIASWSGAAWSSLESGLDGPVESLTVHALDGGRPALIVGGLFVDASGVSSRGLAAWRGCLPACPGDANGDQVIDMADLMIVVDAFNTAEGDALFNGAADFDQNGAVDFKDLNRVIAGFNMGC